MDIKELLKEYQKFPAFSDTYLHHVDQIGDFGDAPLHLASRRGIIEEIKILLENGADIELRGEFSSTPLHCATFMGKLSAVKLLLLHGAKLDVKDIDGQTPLDHARWRAKIEPSSEHLEIVFILEKLLDSNS
jgi:uncharacterized protein